MEIKNMGVELMEKIPEKYIVTSENSSGSTASPILSFSATELEKKNLK
jgi:hypothetical protein